MIVLCWLGSEAHFGRRLRLLVMRMVLVDNRLHLWTNYKADESVISVWDILAAAAPMDNWYEGERGAILLTNQLCSIRIWWFIILSFKLKGTMWEDGVYCGFILVSLKFIHWQLQSFYIVSGFGFMEGDAFSSGTRTTELLIQTGYKNK